ncbi:MAG: hypothetical protein HKM04_05850 [Legionellales bacterium]|nr:hypothetical protein [Legionellales bacterium]
MMTNQGWLGKSWRHFIVPFIGPILFKIDKMRRFAFSTISQIRIEYRASVLSEGNVDEIHAGDRLPWVRQEQGDNYTPLKSLQWQIHVYGTLDDKLLSAAEIYEIDVQVFTWNKAAEKAKLMQNAVYFIRPDGYIGFASKDQTTLAFETYCKAVFL